TPLGGSIAFFPPFFTTTPLPLLLQNKSASLCQRHTAAVAAANPSQPVSVGEA
ncbi:MAG: hypothetical protein JNJ78_20735, partial [Anaerolineae bacterium]|nr:hypothetical protein [Anaerolineae bacterium]